MSKRKCTISNQLLKENEVRRGDFVPKDILSLIQTDHPHFKDSSYISIAELNRYRKKYLSRLIATESEELSNLENKVLDAISNNQILSENIEIQIDKEISYGDRISDMIADFGGSWYFIGVFFAFVLFWIASNIWILTAKPFDPYPFIMLNLILSCLAAIQAPIILMSQNRLEDKDRRRGEYDFQVDLKSELEIKLLHEKIDHLILHQNKKIFEILEIQASYLEDIVDKQS